MSLFLACESLENMQDVQGVGRGTDSATYQQLSMLAGTLGGDAVDEGCAAYLRGVTSAG